MAMGIFEQLASLTKKVKKLCCAIKVGALQSRDIDVIPFEGSPDQYVITEGGIYQFYGGNSTSIGVDVLPPTSVGQTMYIVNTSVDTLSVNGASVFYGSTFTKLNAFGPIGADEIWQMISLGPATTGESTLIWRAYKVYPNIA